PGSWTEAFEMLKVFLDPLTAKNRTIIFIDEFPWIASPKSGFLSAFEHFWNTWASQQDNLVVVICGSAASWMINKIIKNRGGLHNRVTKRIRLLPFTIGETEAYLKERKIKLSRFQVLQLYMAMGGIPQYLKEVAMGESTAQTIDRLCFTKDGILHGEFKNLYHSLFDKAEYHLEVVRALASNGNGLTRTEIINITKLNSGGHVTRLLDELTESGFISSYIPFGKTSKDLLYKLTDEYSLFYLKFIENSRATGAGTWLRFMTGRSWQSWSGFAFEGICMKHVPQLKKAMGIEAVYAEESVWRHRPKSPSDKGAQIDLVLDRADNSISLCITR
ncbi:MAG: ATP-binding protein, partial [Pedobacter sp.]